MGDMVAEADEGVSEFLCVRFSETCPRRRASPVACDERPLRWASRFHILRGSLGEAISIKDRELVHGLLPVFRCSDGDFVHTLTLTDIASGWTECVAMRVREQMLVIEAFDKVAAELPFAMLGVDSDSDSTFMSQSVFDYCKGHGLVQTRSRAYKKNDQA